MFSKETKDTHRECALQTTWLCPTESGPPCKAHNNFWTTTFPQVLWGLKALTFSKGTQGIDGCIFTLLRARVSPDTPTPSKSNLSDQTKTNFCHWENWTSARQNPQHSLWSLDDHQNKHLENSALVTQWGRVQNLQQTPGLRQESQGIMECFALGGTLKVISTPAMGKNTKTRFLCWNHLQWKQQQSLGPPAPNTNTVMWYQSILNLQFKPRSAVSLG